MTPFKVPEITPELFNIVSGDATPSITQKSINWKWDGFDQAMGNNSCSSTKITQSSGDLRNEARHAPEQKGPPELRFGTEHVTRNEQHRTGATSIFGNSHYPFSFRSSAPLNTPISPLRSIFDYATLSSIPSEILPFLNAEIEQHQESSSATNVPFAKRPAAHHYTHEEFSLGGQSPAKRSNTSSGAVEKDQTRNNNVRPREQDFLTGFNYIKSNIRALDDFLHWAGTTLGLTKVDITLYSEQSKAVYDSITTFMADTSQNAALTFGHTLEFYALESQIEQLKAEAHKTKLKTPAPDMTDEEVLSGLQASRVTGEQLNNQIRQLCEQKGKIRCALLTAENSAINMRHQLMIQLLEWLRNIHKHQTPRKPDGDSSAEHNADTKRTDIEGVGRHILKLEEELSDTRSILLSAQSDSAKLKSIIDDQLVQLNDAKTTAANEVRQLQRSHRSTLDQKLHVWKEEQDTAVGVVKRKFQGQIAAAEAKLKEHAKATTRIEDLERKLHGLQQDNTHLGLAKAAVEKNFQTLSLEVHGWKSYKDAYEQITTELDQLEVDYNDVVAERDELLLSRGAFGNASEYKNEDDNTPGPAAFKKGTSTLDVEAQQFLVTSWNRQIQLKEMAIIEKRTQIEEVDTEMLDLTQQLGELRTPVSLSAKCPEATPPTTSAPPVSAPSAVGSPNIIPLDSTPLDVDDTLSKADFAVDAAAGPPVTQIAQRGHTRTNTYATVARYGQPVHHQTAQPKFGSGVHTVQAEKSAVSKMGASISMAATVPVVEGGWDVTVRKGKARQKK